MRAECFNFLTQLTFLFVCWNAFSFCFLLISSFFVPFMHIFVQTIYFKKRLRVQTKNESSHSLITSYQYCLGLLWTSLICSGYIVSWSPTFKLHQRKSYDKCWPNIKDKHHLQKHTLGNMKQPLFQRKKTKSSHPSGCLSTWADPSRMFNFERGSKNRWQLRQLEAI